MWNQQVGVQSMPGRQLSKVAIGRLILQETGTYNPLFQRPYQTHVDGNTVKAITNRVEEYGTGKITGALLAGVAGNVITPMPTPQSAIHIPNGWAERRVRFMLEVHCTFSIGTEMIYYFQGYTSYPGVTQNGHVAPDMEFIINSFVGVSRITMPTPFGMQTKDIVAESSQVMSDSTWQTPQQLNNKMMMRPQDVFTGMQSAYLQHGSLGDNGESGYLDARNMLRREAVRSSRSNNLPGNYVARVIDGYYTGSELANYGQSDMDIFAMSRQQVTETPLGENPFIRLISDIKATGVTNRFFFPDLQSIDPNVGNVTNFTVLGAKQLTQIHSAGSTSYWNGSDRETVVATILSHAVPALMMDLMINKIVFRSTNHDIGGVMNTVIIDAKSLTNTDMTRHYEMFKTRLEREVMFDITFGNQEPYMLDMTVDLFGETWINLTIGSGATTSFVAPSFCDNLFAPVITGDRNQFNAVVNDFDTLVNNVMDSVGKKSKAPVVSTLV